MMHDSKRYEILQANYLPHVHAERKFWIDSRRHHHFDFKPTDQENLPFTVTVASTEHDLMDAISVRQRAYARNLPDFAQSLNLPEKQDHEALNTVLIARHKKNGRALGTVRMELNLHGPLEVEHSMKLPARFSASPLMEATRLGVEQGELALRVKDALFKACYGFCRKRHLRYMIVAARQPLHRMYEKMGLEYVGANHGLVHLPYVANIPHRIMYLDTFTVRHRWETQQHPLLDFYFMYHHEDLVFGI